MEWVKMELKDSKETFQEKGSFYLGPLEKKKITYSVTVPPGSEQGRIYEGITKIIVKRTSLFG